MIKISENYITDAKGHQLGVVLNIKEYRKLIQQAEELECIRAYDAAKASKDKIIPFATAKKEIERLRK